MPTQTADGTSVKQMTEIQEDTEVLMEKRTEASAPHENVRNDSAHRLPGGLKYCMQTPDRAREHEEDRSTEGMTHFLPTR